MMREGGREGMKKGGRKGIRRSNLPVTLSFMRFVYPIQEREKRGLPCVEEAWAGR
jgi:hypothetical protein